MALTKLTASANRGCASSANSGPRRHALALMALPVALVTLALVIGLIGLPRVPALLSALTGLTAQARRQACRSEAAARYGPRHRCARSPGSPSTAPVRGYRRSGATSAHAPVPVRSPHALQR